MTADLNSEISRALDEQHPDLPYPMHARAQFTRAIALLPGDVMWAVAEDKPTVWALSASTLFKIDLRVEENRTLVTSRPVDPSTLAVELEWTEGAEPPTLLDKERRDQGVQENWRESHWTFGHRDGEEYLRVTGRTKTTTEGETADHRELFARALASRAGWGTADS